MSETLIDPGAVAELDRLLSDPAALAAKVSEVAEAARSEFGQRQASLDRALEKVIEARAAAAAEYSEREREMRQREAAVSEREHEVAAAQKKIFERERWVEQRAADLTNRLHA